MMHMCMWFGYDLGEFLFAGINIATRWAFALTWIVLFFVALLFEGSKVYLARVQREAHKKLYPFRSDERRNLLCDRERQNALDEPSSSRNASTGQVRHWASLKLRILINTHQTVIFALHNIVGYLLMLAVMIYNVHLLLAVVFGMMLGYFLFGPKLTRLQMQCYSTRDVICTPECDDTAEGTTPPLLETSVSSESDFFICRTRTCIQPSYYFPASGSGNGNGNGSGNNDQTATCYYGAKQCPSKVARAKRMQATTSCHIERVHIDKEHSPSVEDQEVQLLKKDGNSCCKKKQEPPPTETQTTAKKCCKSETSKPKPDESKCCKKETEVPPDVESEREDSPQVSCCRAAPATSGSEEQIIK